MRIVIVGASDTAVHAARIIIERGHELVIIESDRERIDQLQDELDCSFLHGDGSKPHILEEAGPSQTDVLLCLTNHDQVNIIASLVGRSLGYSRVVPSIHDPDYQSICEELALEDAIIPSLTIGRCLAEIAEGLNPMELSLMIHGEARLLSFELDEEDAGSVDELELPEQAAVICYYRKEDFHLVEKDTTLKAGDQIVILTHSDNLADLKKRFTDQAADDESEDSDEADDSSDDRRNE